ncbi:PAP2-domain-containing protein [Dichomitus squalens]|uniref:Dolichyldiphosphatase n=2 Tax=Dichomitus squalens TaxID=114155 RepID=A0A4Q9PTK0_9APHY|nr:PAP2-domain-containing protein [Dichomitus squalens LYAD-421 SS1]EJF57208.1 PAP2-domain-containing protein [Dichomitus squalens LYAD-421 SS1]TBU47554.1 PAP2-domain-containing protein [Dichomitus squalens]TBU57791.1 PAP2-domain-containing protein [Dichomitus squalens]
MTSRAALDLTYVLYDDSSTTSYILALLTLSPILLNPAYAVLTVWTRELVFLEMWAGQMLCEAFNWALKHIVREERPNHDLGDGYGFPSSHSQWMGYFLSFLILHFSLRHRFVPTGSKVLNWARDIFLFTFITSWSVGVAYSRYYLSYHTPKQVLYGFSIGVTFGTFYYLLTEFVPVRFPNSPLGRFRTALLTNPLSTWFRLRDGWSVWSDAGTEAQYLVWRKEWDRKRLAAKED